jgi:hypothetical protein
VGQLLERAVVSADVSERDALLAGQARRDASTSVGRARGDVGWETAFAVLHWPYWLTANPADRRALVYR